MCEVVGLGSGVGRGCSGMGTVLAGAAIGKQLSMNSKGAGAKGHFFCLSRGMRPCKFEAQMLLCLIPNTVVP